MCRRFEPRNGTTFRQCRAFVSSRSVPFLPDRSIPCAPAATSLSKRAISADRRKGSVNQGISCAAILPTPILCHFPNLTLPWSSPNRHGVAGTGRAAERSGFWHVRLGKSEPVRTQADSSNSDSVQVAPAGGPALARNLDARRRRRPPLRDDASVRSRGLARGCSPAPWLNPLPARAARSGLISLTRRCDPLAASD